MGADVAGERLGLFDIKPALWDTRAVKSDKARVSEKKTRGALIVEKYRPRMNKLTAEERQQLRDRAMQLAFGHESDSATTPRR